MAYSSATRTGLPYMGRALPRTIIWARLIRWERAEAMRFGEAMSP